MAVLNFAETTTAPPRATGNRSLSFGGLQNPTDRPKAKVWMNVGYEANGKFITLPLGQPIDTMEAAEVRGQNEDFVKQRNAQNDLLKMIQELGATMEPGAEQEINLVVKLRRVNEQLEIAKADNEYSFNPASLVKLAAAAE